MSILYNSKINRRDGLKWLGAMTSMVAVGGVLVACDTQEPELPPVQEVSHWPDLKFDVISGPKYGQDPDMVNPTTPWSRTLSPEQLNMVARLCDIICPTDDRGPSATDVGVPDVIDEWISAPYSAQQRDRVLILNGLQWLDDEARQRFEKTFLMASEIEQIQIIDDIAFEASVTNSEFEHAVYFFAKMRSLVLGGYFTSPEGIIDIGYIGNVPIIGDYPGPTQEAMAHLEQIIAKLS
jgi:hypothetical protein